MKILGIDTTSPYCSVAVTEDGRIQYSKILNNGNTHSETLLPLIKETLENAEVTLEEIELFGISSCPGSFTGVRIGASTVKGLAFGTSKPCVGVSTLEALAYNISHFEGIACPVMDARRNQFYNALFQVKNGEVTRLTEDRLISSSDLQNELLDYSEPVFLVGDGYFLAKNSIVLENIKETPSQYIPQNGVSVALLAERIYLESENKNLFNDIELKPGYLRASQAERERQSKLK